jgi:hypothetical protein
LCRITGSTECKIQNAELQSESAEHRVQGVQIAECKIQNADTEYRVHEITGRVTAGG